MKILIAGLGSIGQRHARNLRALCGSDVDLLAYRVRGLPHVINDDLTIEPGAVVEERYGIRSFDRLEAALAERPAAAIICNPTIAHLSTAEAALGAGCHVMIEKPLSHGHDGVDEVIELATRRGLIAAVGYQMRFHPALIRLRELLCRRAFGAVVAVRSVWTEYLPDAHPYEDYRESYAARADLGGGVILCFIHEFDYLCWLFGMPRRVQTTGGTLGDLDIDVEDTAHSIMTHEIGGRIVRVELRQSFAQRSRSRTCEITCELAVIRVDLDQAELTVTGADGAAIARELFPGFHRNQLFVDELTQFLAAIDGRGEPAASIRDGAVSLRVALAARESLRTGVAQECR